MAHKQNGEAGLIAEFHSLSINQPTNQSVNQSSTLKTASEVRFTILLLPGDIFNQQMVYQLHVCFVFPSGGHVKLRYISVDISTPNDGNTML